MIYMENFQLVVNFAGKEGGLCSLKAALIVADDVTVAIRGHLRDTTLIRFFLIPV